MLLSLLTDVNLKDLHKKRSDGMRIIDSLYEAYRGHGAIPHEAKDTKERYFSVFDVAMQCRLGCWVQDYVEVVCADRYLASNDPLEAQLLDGNFIKEWCQRCLQRSETDVVTALKSESLFKQFCSRSLQQELSSANTLVNVLAALDRLASSPGGHRTDE